VRLVKAIDEQFANSPAETKTDTEKASPRPSSSRWQHPALDHERRQCRVLHLLLVTGNTMAIAVRERTRELAVLKAVDSRAASCWPWSSWRRSSWRRGGGIGLGLAKLFTLRGIPPAAFCRFFHLPGTAVVSGLVLALRSA